MNTEENRSTMRKEVYTYLESLTVLDFERLAAQGYYFVINDGHVIAMLPEGKEYKA